MTTDAEDHGDAPAQPLDPTVQSKQPAAGKAPAGQTLSKRKLASIELAAIKVTEAAALAATKETEATALALKETEAAAYAVASELFSM